MKQELTHICDLNDIFAETSVIIQYQTISSHIYNNEMRA